MLPLVLAAALAAWLGSSRLRSRCRRGCASANRPVAAFARTGWCVERFRSGIVMRPSREAKWLEENTEPAQRDL
jgi:hypothetical protein